MASRILQYFQIIHSQPDMGALSESIKKITLQKLGERVWRQKIKRVERSWSEIKDALQVLSLDYGRTRVYQDGLPVCGKELDIVLELAKKGSLNHQILMRLHEQGATIMGTESVDLLMEEYAINKNIFAPGDYYQATELEATQKAGSDLLLGKRDVFIASRIDQTLHAGETGILFLGMLHNLAGRLPKDIEIHYPISRQLGKRK